ncbi:MAG: carboxypeptidase regulatory-like domain-containing protein [Terracidiphilus sp.]
MSSPLRIVVIVFTFVLVLSFPGTAPAQVTSSYISGHVIDAAGGTIPGAQVTLTSKQDGRVRKMLTDAGGRYSFIGLAPASYSLSASAQGFGELTRRNISLDVDTALVLDIRLTVGGPETRIEVTAPAPPLQTESADLGAVIDQQFTQTLPLNARNFLQLALLAPGAFPTVEGSQLSSNGGNGLEVNGGREEYNDFLLDGADNNDPYISGYVVEPAVDSVQEFKMVTSSYDAEYGRSGAGQVNVITRSGTNEFHGTGYEYLRNKVLDARNYFDDERFIKPPYIRNQFGVAGGGPIRRDKTFFFANTDFYRQREAQSVQAVVPTDTERGGNLTDTGIIAINPLTGLPFLNDTITDISPIAADIINLYPKPNLTGSVNNFLGQPSQPENHVQNTFRGDQQLSPNDNLTLRYSMGIVNIFQPYPEGVSTNGAVPGFGDYQSDHTHNAMIREQHTFGANAINSLLIAFNRFSRDFLPQNYQTDVGTLWGVDWLNLPPRDYGYPTISVTGYSQVGDDYAFPNLRHTNTYQIADNFTFTHGKNTFETGVDLRKLQLNGRLDELARGSLTFSGAISGSPLGDLLLGYPSFGLQSQANNPIRLRSMSSDAYLQDEWRLRSNLVFSLGARYEFNSPATDPTNGMSELDLQTGQIVRVGTNGVTRSGIYPDYKNFAPRVGVAWHAVPDLVVRAGYGVFYDAGMFIIGSSAFFNPPQFTLSVFFPSAAGLLTLQDPFPTNAGYTPPASLSVLSPNIITPYLQQWNFTTEGTLGKRGTLTLSYVGSSGSHLIRERDLNQPLLSSTGSQDNLQSRRPYPAYSAIFDVESEAASNYNAMEVRFTGHITPSISVWSAYTWSHSIDDQSAFLGDTADPNFPQNSHNLRAERGPSSFDMRQRFVAAYVLALPHGNRWTRNTEFQGIATAEGGQPFTPTLPLGDDNSNTGNSGQQAGSDRPNKVGNPYQSGAIAANPTCVAPPGPTRTPAQWFNPCAFETAPPNTYGNAGRNSLLGPGYASFDISLLRRFTLHERATLTLEAQSFNLFNRPDFALPGSYQGESNFGVISSGLSTAISSVSDRRELQFAARLSF